MKNKKVFLCRCFQKILKLLAYFIKWPVPKKIEGTGKISEIPTILDSINCSKVLIIISRKVNSLGQFKDVYEKLTSKKINYVVYDQVNGEPTVKMVEKIAAIYLENKCDAVVACGGGSVIDVAKLAAASANNPNVSINKMRGIFKIKKKLPFLIAVPTTSGSGSECTVAAVVTDEEKNDKFAVNDPKLVPKVAILDATLTYSLPSNLTASTGMDALTHAIECYIGQSNTKNTKKWSKEAIMLILENLPLAYSDATNEIAKTNMQRASYLAGAAFTRGYVGYVHAIAHAIGGLYHIPHGVANAVVLPYVLSAYGEKTKMRLNVLVEGNDFIQIVKSLNELLQLPKNIGEIREEDFDFLINHIQNETWPLYPVPNYLSNDTLKELLMKIKGQD